MQDPRTGVGGTLDPIDKHRVKTVRMWNGRECSHLAPTAPGASGWGYGLSGWLMYISASFAVRPKVTFSMP